MADSNNPPKVMLITGLAMLVLGLGSCTFSGRSAQTMQTAIFNKDNAGTVVAMGNSREITARESVLLVFTTPSGVRCTLTGSDGKVLKPKPAPKVPVDVPDSELTFDAATDVQVTTGVTYTVECPLPKGAETGRFAVANLPGGSTRLSLLGVTGIGGGLLTMVGLGLTIGGLFGRFRWKRKGQAAPIPDMSAKPPTMVDPTSADDDH
jgi:hypothetical protein